MVEAVPVVREVTIIKIFGKKSAITDVILEQVAEEIPEVALVALEGRATMAEGRG